MLAGLWMSGAQTNGAIVNCSFTCGMGMALAVSTRLTFAACSSGARRGGDCAAEKDARHEVPIRNALTTTDPVRTSMHTSPFRDTVDERDRPARHCPYPA